MSVINGPSSYEISIFRIEYVKHTRSDCGKRRTLCCQFCGKGIMSLEIHEKRCAMNPNKESKLLYASDSDTTTWHLHQNASVTTGDSSCSRARFLITVKYMYVDQSASMWTTLNKVVEF